MRQTRTSNCLVIPALRMQHSVHTVRSVNHTPHDRRISAAIHVTASFRCLLLGLTLACQLTTALRYHLYSGWAVHTLGMISSNDERNERPECPMIPVGGFNPLGMLLRKLEQSLPQCIEIMPALCR